MKVGKTDSLPDPPKPVFESFAHPYVSTGFPRRPGPGHLSNEEALSLGRSHVLEGLHYFGQVHASGCARCATQPVKELEYEKAVAFLQSAQLECQAHKAENYRLLKENEQTVSQNALLLAQLEESRQQLELLAAANSEKETLREEALAAKAEAFSDMTALKQQLTDFRELYTKKVADLDALCSERHVLIQQQEKQLENQKRLLEETTLQASKTSAELTQMQQTNLFHQQMAEQSGADISWLLKTGVAGVVRAILRSGAFGVSCASLQEASIRLGRVQGCAALVEACPEVLAGKSLPYSYDGEKELIMERYTHLVEQPYEILTLLAAENVDVETLKKKLVDDGSSGEGSSGV